MNLSIQDVSRLTGTTSRTLRHYGDIGLLEPSAVGRNGYRYYNEDSLVRLQRILLLRELGLSLTAIAKVLEGQTRHADALVTHLHWLHQEKDRINRQIRSVEQTITKLEGGEKLMAEEIFDGFDHNQYRDEVEERWGKSAFEKSDSWWRSLSESERKDWASTSSALSDKWRSLASSGADPAGNQAQDLAKEHFDWLKAIPGTPGWPNGPTSDYLLGLAEMYVADSRFAENYGGAAGAEFVKQALTAFVNSRA
ncbi:MAG: MerR family transcriptional regulator [Microbacteriaceae bacterium]|nr:MerR family transcriptional regulator [Microbacteriaceae bacterium]